MLYLQDKTALKSFKETAEHLAAIAWAYSGRPITELPEVAKAVVDEAPDDAGKTRSAATIRNRLACLKAACRWAWKKHALTEHDPTGRMQLPAVKNARHVYLMRRDMLRLARASTKHSVRVAIRTAFYTGLRLGELYRVRPEDGMLHLDDTKNGTRRSVPAHSRIKTCLPYLPLTIPQKTLQREIEIARAAAKLDHVHFHDLRHSAASEMVNAGVDLFTVGIVLGHKDPRSTARYSHLTAHTLADAVGRIGQKSPHTGKT